jgi:hypothetical protein
VFMRLMARPWITVVLIRLVLAGIVGIVALIPALLKNSP